MTTDSSTETLTKIPTHVAIIMDGNGRWAANRGLARLAGHQAGTDNLRRVVHASIDFGIKYLTLYAFSTENWGRPAEEVEGLMRLLEDLIDREVNELHKEGVQLRLLGHLDPLNPALKDKITRAIELTRNNHRLVLSLAFNYGGRDEIVCAIRKMIAEGLAPEEISDEVVSKHLFTVDTPDPDLIIRTSGEMRLSNFLIWQAAYAEWYVTPTLWPDFDRDELYKALLAYSARDRRYGRLSFSTVE